MRTGGKILIDQLVAQGCRTLFTVPGESFLPALDALFDEGPIRTIVCRHEGGAAMMAEASGKLTGGPGVAFVSRAAGATNATSGVYIAHHDATPLLLLVGLSARSFEPRGAFREIDLQALFGGMAKWVAVARAPERIPEYVARAYQTAQSGRPGPVVLGFPADVLRESAETADAAPARPAVPAPPSAEMARLKDKLSGTQRPFLLLGGSGWSREAAQSLTRFAEAFDMPIASAFRRQDHFDNRHPAYVGHLGTEPDPKLASAVRGADLLLIIGEAPDESTTGGLSLIAAPSPTQFIAHAHPFSDEIGRLFRTDIPIVSAPGPFARSLSRLKPPPRHRWARLRRDLRASYERFLKPAPAPGGVQMAEVIAALSSELPETTIVTNGAGNYAAFLHRHFQYKSYPTQLSPGSDTMGYGLPAAIAAKLAYPERAAVALAGDGCMLMTAQELATAVQYGLPIVLIVANNAMYGTIRMHQERHYPGRVIGTSLVNLDFAAYARSFGAAGATVARTEDFVPVLRRALKAPIPTVIELKLERDALGPHRAKASRSARKG